MCIFTIYVHFHVFPLFRSIRCLRNIIHWNLITTFILRNVMWFLLQMIDHNIHESNEVSAGRWQGPALEVGVLGLYKYCKGHLATCSERFPSFPGHSSSSISSSNLRFDIWTSVPWFGKTNREIIGAHIKKMSVHKSLLLFTQMLLWENVNSVNSVIALSVLLTVSHSRRWSLWALYLTVSCCVTCSHDNAANLYWDFYSYWGKICWRQDSNTS